MSLADYQTMLQEARGHQLVYLEDLVAERGDDFLERHLVDEAADPSTALRGGESSPATGSRRSNSCRSASS
jgi:hypothetical protein